MFSAGRPMSFWLTSLFPGPSNSAQHIESIEEIFAEGRNEWRSEWMNWEWIFMTRNLNIRQQKKLPLKGIQTAVDNVVSLFRQQILLKFIMTVVRELKQDSISDPKTPKQQCISCFKKVQGDKDMDRNDRQCQFNHHHSTSKNPTQPNIIMGFLCLFTAPSPSTHVGMICYRFKLKSFNFNKQEKKS